MKLSSLSNVGLLFARITGNVTQKQVVRELSRRRTARPRSLRKAA
jgi:hypothetical protein